MACDKPNPAYCGLPQIQISGIGQGPAGTNGASAYEIWLRQGNSGTVADFLAALKGPKGRTGRTGQAGLPGLLSDIDVAALAGKNGANRPVAYFTGARFQSNPISAACNNLTLLAGGRRLELGTVPFSSGTYLLQINLQFAWTGVVSGDLNGNCWLYQDETPLLEIDWGRLHRGTGWVFGTIATLNESFVCALVKGASLTLRASAAFTLVGGSLSIFNAPNYIVGEPQPVAASFELRIKRSYEFIAYFWSPPGSGYFNVPYDAELVPSFFYPDVGLAPSEIHLYRDFAVSGSGRIWGVPSSGGAMVVSDIGAASAISLGQGTLSSLTDPGSNAARATAALAATVPHTYTAYVMPTVADSANWPQHRLQLYPIPALYKWGFVADDAAFDTISSTLLTDFYAHRYNAEPELAPCYGKVATDLTLSMNTEYTWADYAAYIENRTYDWPSLATQQLVLNPQSGEETPAVVLASANYGTRIGATYDDNLITCNVPGSEVACLFFEYDGAADGSSTKTIKVKLERRQNSATHPTGEVGSSLGELVVPDPGGEVLESQDVTLTSVYDSGTLYRATLPVTIKVPESSWYLASVTV